MRNDIWVEQKAPVYERISSLINRTSGVVKARRVLEGILAAMKRVQLVIQGQWDVRKSNTTQKDEIAYL